jgi:hypothetical protein
MNCSLIFTALLAASLPAHAEFYKCVEDGTGKISFSDVPCHGKDSGQRITVKPTNQFDGSGYRREAARERQQDAERYYRKAQEEQDEADARAEAAARRAQQQAVQAPEQKRRSLPVQNQAPSIITNCDAGGCWDNLGGRYNKGAGNTYFPASGGPACQMIGGQMRCP